MRNKYHRDNADAARTAAADSKLPNVRERELRSAKAHDALAAEEEQVASETAARLAEAAARKAINAADNKDKSS